MKMINPPAIADSSGLISLIFKTDSNHSKARLISKNLAETDINLIVPGEVITEIINVLGKKTNHKIALRSANKILSQTDYQFIETTPEIRLLALKKFSSSKESISFTDCLVMAFADQYKTKLIFGFDQSFSQSGYQNP
jgi:predicted nucleic acid-binding protein